MRNSFFSSRRRFLQTLGLSSAVLPFLGNLNACAGASEGVRKQRLVVMFSPNGIVPKTFWPDAAGADFELKESLLPLAEFKDRMLMLKGVCDRIQGDGDRHMRGIGCLLTGTELFPGNIQGGSDTPAGWSSGISLDQELRNFLQSQAETRTRFGSLEFGVLVPERADTWTRLSYAGPNQPVAPIDDPYQMFEKLYGGQKDRRDIVSVLDDITGDLARLESAVGAEDRKLLEEHAAYVRDMERELQAAEESDELGHTVPELTPDVREDNDNMPKISRMQIDLMVNSFVADFSRVATLQYTRSVGQAKMRWLDIQEGHHELSHEPDSNEDAQQKLTKINKWFCEELAYLTKRLAETPEPDGSGSLLDNTTIIWSNELGQGNNHTLDNIPFVLLGNGLNFRMGRSLDYGKVPHNRLLLSIAHAFGHHIDTFGNPNYCGDGPLPDLT